MFTITLSAARRGACWAVTTVAILAFLMLGTFPCSLLLIFWCGGPQTWIALLLSPVLLAGIMGFLAALNSPNFEKDEHGPA